MRSVIVHPAWLERIGIMSVVAFAQQSGLVLVQSRDRKRLRLVPGKWV